VSRISRNTVTHQPKTKCHASAEVIHDKVLLRGALSSKTPFAKLMRQGQPDLPTKAVETAPPQASGVDPASYRMSRKLSPDRQAELVALYEDGASMLELAGKFECHRHTVMRLLRAKGMKIRPQKLMTPELVARAAALYAQDHSLEEVGRLLGLEASTIGKALKRAGVQLRPPAADRRHQSRNDS
jgi:DNA-directed RNA polymerase specialized sigma24 family protein